MRDGEGNGIPLQYSCLENPMDGGAWKAAVHGVAEGRTWLSNFTFTFHFHALEKEMATHSSVLAWRIPGMGKPGGLLSMGSHRVGHDWSDLAIVIAKWETSCDVCHVASLPPSCFALWGKPRGQQSGAVETACLRTWTANYKNYLFWDLLHLRTPWYVRK